MVERGTHNAKVEGPIPSAATNLMEFIRRIFSKVPELLEGSLDGNERDIMFILDQSGYASYAEVFSALLEVRTRRKAEIIMPYETIKIIDGLSEKELVEHIEHPKFSHTDFWGLADKGKVVLNQSMRTMRVSKL